MRRSLVKFRESEASNHTPSLADFTTTTPDLSFRYTQVSRTVERQVSFADWELMRQGLRLEPLLQAISDFLDDQKDMIEQVRCDLTRGLKNAETGRSGLTPLTPATLKAINDLVVQAAVDLELEDGQKLRVDTTVVQTDIHHPTDNTLLWDVVRVVTRLVGRLAAAMERRRIKGFRDRTRSARRRMYEIQRMTTRQRHEQQTGTYRELIGIAEEVVESARMVLEKTNKARGKDMLADMAIEEIRKEIERHCGLGSRVIDQARRRVLHGEQVLYAEKIYSIFEPHTDLIKRGKVQTPIEFGHKVFLAESAQGLITQYEVLKGNPSDEVHVAPSLQRHKQAFGRAPELYGSDRGFFSEQNVTSCTQDGVKVVCIPQRGGKKTPEREAYEKSAQFKEGQRFRAGIEGRISVLFRGRGMKRCLAEGAERFELWVAAAVLANNLMNIAALLTRRSSRRRKAI